MNWYLEALRKYAVFSGRARRKEYWMFVLFTALITIAIVVLENLVGIADSETGYGVIGALYSLAMVLPSIAVSVRRLHDIGRSGWWFLINFIPLIGSLILLFFHVQPGQPHENQYGPDPKDEHSPA